MAEFDFMSAIKKIAPMVAGTLGTPLAGLAVSAICGAVSPSDSQSIQDAHANDPVNGAISKLSEMLQNGSLNTVQIKQAENAHAETMAQLGYKNASDLEAIAAGDRDSARKRQEALKDQTPAHLAYMIIGGFIGVCAAQLVAFIGYPEQIAKVPPAAWTIIGNISGYLAAEAKAAASYYFGSTTGSKNKDATINAALNK